MNFLYLSKKKKPNRNNEIRLKSKKLGKILGNLCVGIPLDHRCMLSSNLGIQGVICSEINTKTFDLRLKKLPKI